MREQAPPHLVTPRLELRMMTPEDYPRWQKAMETLPAPRDKWATTAPADLSAQMFEERCATNLSLWRQDSYVHLDVIHRRDEAYIGTVSLMDISRGLFQNAYIGYRLDARYHRKRYGYEACVGLIGLGFGQLGLHRLEAGIEPDNEPSIRLAKSLGFRYEGLSLRRLFIRGQWLDMGIWAMTAEEWSG